MYRVIILESAQRELKQLDRQVAKQLVTRIQWLSAHVEQLHPVPLSGELSQFFKLRSGDYRILYTLQREEELVVIHQIGHRRDIYREK